MPQQPCSTDAVFYRVWSPGKIPLGDEPLLTLHNLTALRFFVEAMSHRESIISFRPFMIAAYEVVNPLIEREIAWGKFQFIEAEGGRMTCKSLFETGRLRPGTGRGIISAALLCCIIDQNETGEIEQLL